MEDRAWSDRVKAKEGAKVVNLSMCEDKKMGLKFFCNPDWPFLSEENVILITIAEKPVVTMTIARASSPVDSLNKLDQNTIKEIGQYRQGFSTEMLKVAQENALHVEATHLKHPDIQLSDYYFIHDGTIYCLLFSVNPLTKFDEYKELFRRIKDSLKFYNPKEV